jgi:hypothetical protein
MWKTYYPKKERPKFLLGKLKQKTLLLGAAALSLLVLVLILSELSTPESSVIVASDSVPARSIETVSNVSQLWRKDDFYLARVSSVNGQFFIIGEQSLAFLGAKQSEGRYNFNLEAINIFTGQTQWQTTINDPELVRIYDSNFFILSREWLDQAPARENRKLQYCLFWDKEYSLSTYELSTGQEIWSYGYRGANLPTLYFVDRSVYLEGSHEHGTHRLSINIDTNSGLITDQRCSGFSPPLNSEGIYGSSFVVNSIDNQDYSGCSRDNRYCFVTEGNRLTVLAGNSKEPLAYIEFGGEQLTHFYIDAVVQGNIVVIHLLDSHQLFAFHLS